MSIQTIILNPYQTNDINRSSPFNLLPVDLIPPLVVRQPIFTIKQKTWLAASNTVDFGGDIIKYQQIKPNRPVVSVLQGTVIEFNIEVQDNSLPSNPNIPNIISYVWKKDGAPISQLNNLNNKRGTNIVQLTSDYQTTGQYICEVSNLYGTTTSSPFRIDVIDPYEHPKLYKNLIINGSGENGLTGWTTDADIKTLPFHTPKFDKNIEPQFSSFRIGGIIAEIDGPILPEFRFSIGNHYGMFHRLYTKRKAVANVLNEAFGKPYIKGLSAGIALNEHERWYSEGGSIPQIIPNEDYNTNDYNTTAGFFPGLAWMDKYNKNDTYKIVGLTQEYSDAPSPFYFTRDKIKFLNKGGKAETSLTQTVDLTDIADIIDGNAYGITHATGQFFAYVGAGITDYKIKFQEEGKTEPTTTNYYVADYEAYKYEFNEEWRSDPSLDWNIYYGVSGSDSNGTYKYHNKNSSTNGTGSKYSEVLASISPSNLYSQTSLNAQIEELKKIRQAFYTRFLDPNAAPNKSFSNYNPNTSTESTLTLGSNTYLLVPPDQPNTFGIPIIKQGVFPNNNATPQYVTEGGSATKIIIKFNDTGRPYPKTVPNPEYVSRRKYVGPISTPSATWCINDTSTQIANGITPEYHKEKWLTADLLKLVAPGRAFDSSASGSARAGAVAQAILTGFLAPTRVLFDAINKLIGSTVNESSFKDAHDLGVLAADDLYQNWYLLRVVFDEAKDYLQSGDVKAVLGAEFAFDLQEIGNYVRNNANSRFAIKKDIIKTNYKDNKWTNWYHINDDGGSDAATHGRDVIAPVMLQMWNLLYEKYIAITRVLYNSYTELVKINWLRNVESAYYRAAQEKKQYRIKRFTDIEIQPKVYDKTRIELTYYNAQNVAIKTETINGPNEQDVWAIKEKAFFPLTLYPIYQCLNTDTNFYNTSQSAVDQIPQKYKQPQLQNVSLQNNGMYMVGGDAFITVFGQQYTRMRFLGGISDRVNQGIGSGVLQKGINSLATSEDDAATTIYDTVNSSTLDTTQLIQGPYQKFKDQRINFTEDWISNKVSDKNANFLMNNYDFATYGGAYPPNNTTFNKKNSPIHRTYSNNAVYDLGAAAMFGVGLTAIIPKTARSVQIKIIFEHTSDQINDTNPALKGWTKDEIYSNEFGQRNSNSIRTTKYGNPRCGITSIKYMISANNVEKVDKYPSYSIPPTQYTVLGLEKQKYNIEQAFNTAEQIKVGSVTIPPEPPQPEELAINLYTSGGEYKTSTTDDYVGYYHIHKDKGLMVGKRHTAEPHEYLYPISSTTTSEPAPSPSLPSNPSPSNPTTTLPSNTSNNTSNNTGY